MGDPLDLDRDLPTSADDVAVLGRLRTGPKLSFDEYVAALATLDPPTAAELRARSGPGGAPFRLPG